MSRSLKLGLVGLGKIARDQHLPAIAATPGVELVAVASRNATAHGITSHSTLEAMLAAEPAIDAVILCQPPQARYDAARAALLAGKHVFLEKPPGATVTEVEALMHLAGQRGLTLYASWHSRYGAAVSAAKAWIAERAIFSVQIVWKEDVRQWHPGQDWIWEPGGFGVFDPGINALSIVTAILPEPLRLLRADLETPSNRHAPIAARLALATASGVPIAAEFDWRQTGAQTWDIVVQAAGSTLCLTNGGNGLSIEGNAISVPPEGEYPAMYREFVDMVTKGSCLVDVSPLQIVADAFLRGQYHPTGPFHE